VATPSDLGRLIRELADVDEHLMQAELKKHEAKPPRTSKFLDQCLEMNDLDLMKADHRKALRQALTVVKDHAPVLHMSFSADPPVAFLEKLMAWMRREIHPTALITIGLQPNLGAGVIVRTKNKYFDLSLRKDFENKQDLLKEAIASKMASNAKEVAETQPAEGAAA
jgi:F0F1-type ATP synthase delta subunit